MEENTSTSAQQPQKNNTMMFVIGIVVLLVIGIGIVFLMNRSSQTQPAAMTPQPSAAESSPAMEATTVPNPSGEVMAGEAKEFTVTGKNFSFSPNVIRVKKGDTVKIIFKNTGGIHDFVIDDFDVQTAQIQGGESEEVTFTADKAGTYEFYCSVGNHRAQGMKGQLIVE